MSIQFSNSRDVAVGDSHKAINGEPINRPPMPCQINGKDGVALNGHSESLVSHQVLTPRTPITWVLRKLSRAYQFSVDCDRSRWDFAVEISEVLALGVTSDELRWLMGKGLIQQANEITPGNGVGRAFEAAGGFTISDASCFVATNAGLQVAEELAAAHGDDFLVLPINEPVSSTLVELLPTWDDQRNELRLGSVLVKRFKWRAANQEVVLAAFQEDGWPARIDDPLSPVPETDPKRRLSDTIKCLNRKQQNSVLRFSGDGTGEGVLWNVVQPELVT